MKHTAPLAAIVTLILLAGIGAFFLVMQNDNNESATATAKVPIQIAVASNFAEVSQTLADRFQSETGVQVSLSFGSTSKHYTQIKNGAPFDCFFAADAKHPELLERENIGVAGTRFTYAIGKLVLWQPAGEGTTISETILREGKFNHLALANPRLAPYGGAAVQVLRQLKLYDELKLKIVQGENIGQTYQFVSSGNAELGFVALSQVKRPEKPMTGAIWEVPQAFYKSIDQQAIIIKDSPAVRQFMDFMRSEWAINVIRSYGYDVP